MGDENRTEDLGQEGNHFLGKMLQGPVRDTIRPQGLADLETPNGFMNLVRVG